MKGLPQQSQGNLNKTARKRVRSRACTAWADASIYEDEEADLTKRVGTPSTEVLASYRLTPRPDDPDRTGCCVRTLQRNCHPL